MLSDTLLCEGAGACHRRALLHLRRRGGDSGEMARRAPLANSRGVQVTQRGAPSPPRAREAEARLPSTGVRPVDATAPRRSAPNAAVAILRRGCGARGLVESDVDRIWLPRPASGAVRKKKNFSSRATSSSLAAHRPRNPGDFFLTTAPCR